jgi:pyruvate ferredoxin oxidoreductase alpha subunit
MREAGHRIGCVALCSFRPFPLGEVRAALERAKRIVVLEKCLAVGIGGILADGVRKTLFGLKARSHTVIAGLGGRAIGRRSLRALFERAERDELEPLSFLDLSWDIVNREIERAKLTRRSGPIAENILKEIGAVAARIG